MALNSQTTNDKLNPTRIEPMATHSFEIFDYANPARKKITRMEGLNFRADGTLELAPDNTTPDCYALEDENDLTTKISVYGEWSNIVNVTVGTTATAGTYGRFVTKVLDAPYATFTDAVAAEVAQIKFFETGVTGDTVKAGLLCSRITV